MKTFLSDIILGFSNPDGIATVKFLTDENQPLTTISVPILNIKGLSVADIEANAIRQALATMKTITENSDQNL